MLLPLFCAFGRKYHPGTASRFSQRDPNLLERYRQGLRRILAQEVPIEMKPVNPPDFFHQSSQEPKQLVWVRAKGYIGKTRILTPACFPGAASSCPGEGSVNWRERSPPFGTRRLCGQLFQWGSACPWEPPSSFLLVGAVGAIPVGRREAPGKESATPSGTVLV